MANGRTPQLNAFVTNLTNPVAAPDLEITVDAVPAITAPYYMVIDPLNPEREYVLVTAVNGNVLTVTRSLAGSGSTTHLATQPVAIAPMSQHFDDIWDVLEGAAPPFDHATDITNVLPDQHHTRYTDAEAIAAVGNPADGVYLPLAGGTMEGILSMGGFTLSGLGLLESDADFDVRVPAGSSFLARIDGSTRIGATDAGPVTLHDETGAVQVQVLAAETDINNQLNVNTNPIVQVADPVNPQDAATKAYVDGSVPASISEYALDTNTADGRPGQGLFRRNNGVLANVTFLYIDKLSAVGLDLSDELLGVTTGQTAFLQNYDATNFEVYAVTGPAVDAVDYVRIPVAYESNTNVIVVDDRVILRLTGAADLSATYLRLDGTNNPVAPNNFLTQTVGDARYALAGSGLLPLGGGEGQTLRKTSPTDQDATWYDHVTFDTVAPSNPKQGDIWVNTAEDGGDHDHDGTYLPILGGTMQGDITMNGNDIPGFVQDGELALYMPLSGGTFGGAIDMGGNNINNVGDIPGFVQDGELSAYMPLTGGVLTGGQALASTLVRNVTVGTTQPGSPAVGDLWLDTN